MEKSLHSRGREPNYPPASVGLVSPNKDLLRKPRTGQRTTWKTAVLPKLCEQLRYLQEEHLDERAANDAKGAPLLSCVAGDKQSRVQTESEAKKACEASPWNEDKDVGDVVRLAPTQMGDRVPPKSVARGQGVFETAMEANGCGSSTGGQASPRDVP